MIERLKKYEGLDMDKQRTPGNPNFTVRDTIKLADEIAELKRQLENRTRHRDKAEAYVVSLSQQLAESQAREVEFRDTLKCVVSFGNTGEVEMWRVKEALALPHDDTALKEYIEKAISNSSKDV